MSRWWRTRGSSGRAAGIGLRAVPADDSRTPRRRGPLARVGRGLVGALVALTLMVGTLAAVSLATAPARAFDFACAVGGGDAANIGPESKGVGTTFWLPETSTPGIYHAEWRNTLWEVVGTRGLLWSYAPNVPTTDARENFNRDDSDSNFDDACSPVDASAGYLAQLLFEPSRFLGGLTIGVKELAIGTAPFEEFYTEQAELLDIMRAGIFQPALVMGVIAAGLWVMTRFRRQDDQRETYSGIIWSAVIVIGVSAMLVGDNHRTVTEFVDRQVSDFNYAALESTSRLTARGGERAGPCRIQPLQHSDGNDMDITGEGSRKSSCMLYEMLLYNPWHLGQFGTSSRVVVDELCYDKNNSDVLNCEAGGPEAGDGDYRDLCVFSPYRCVASQRPTIENSGGDEVRTRIDLGIQQVIAQAHTEGESGSDGEARSDRGDNPDYTPYERLWRGVYLAMADQHTGKYMMWKGSEPTSRMATAVSTLLVNVIVFVAVGLIALLAIFWHGVMFIAWILLPVVGAVAAYPPARRIFAGYVGIIVQAIFLRAVLGLFLVLLLSVMSAINLSEGNTGLKIILMIIAAAAMWKLLTSLRSGQMGPSVVSTAGDQGMLPSDQRMTTGMSQTARRGGRTAGRVAVGAAAGGARGARAGYTVSNRRGIGRVTDAVRGAGRGAASGGTAATRTGRQKHWSEAMGGNKAAEAAWRDKWRRQQRNKPDPDQEPDAE